jgi:RecA-family ATPase
MNKPRSLAEFLLWKPPARNTVLNAGLMYEGSKVILYGKYKSMKSMLASRFMLACSTGTDWLGFHTPQEGLKVLYLQLEVPEAMLQERFLVMTGGEEYGVLEDPMIWTEAFLKLDTDSGFKALEEALVEHKPNVLVIDPLYKLLSGNISEQHHIGTLLDNLDKLIAVHRISLMIISHSRKPGTDKTTDNWGSDDLLGSVLLSAWPDSVIKVERKKGGGLTVSFDVVRHAKTQIQPIDLEVTDDLNFVRKVNL